MFQGITVYSSVKAAQVDGFCYFLNDGRYIWVRRSRMTKQGLRFELALVDTDKALA